MHVFYYWILSACQTKSDTFSGIVNKWSTSANFQFKLSLSRSREDFRLRKETDIHTSHVIWNLNDNIIVYACQVCYYSYWKDTFLLCVCGIYVSVLRVDTFMDLKREWKTESFNYPTCFMVYFRVTLLVFLCNGGRCHHEIDIFEIHF